MIDENKCSVCEALDLTVRNRRTGKGHKHVWICWTCYKKQKVA